MGEYEPVQSDPAGESVLDALRRALAGTVTVMPGVDLTAPLDEHWDAMEA